jgi:hypothetical protein
LEKTDRRLEMLPASGKMLAANGESAMQRAGILLLSLVAILGGPSELSSQAAESDVLWWSFRPALEPLLPEVDDHGWSQAAIDRFLFARLADAGMQPPPSADKRTLIRRATFDLTGLPPTPDEIQAFLENDSPDAFANLIDRLLASPHYGEQWGRHWLDVVRYADTSGCNGDFPIPQAYRYRNYVVDSFNSDKPYDQFVREQIAGDLLPFESLDERNEQVTATGYLAISRRFSSLAEEFHLTLDDTIDNLGKAFLGLSISCARCHEHKFDPIPQKDYYALYGIFQSTKYAFPGTEIYRHPQDLVPLVPPEQMAQIKPLLDRMAELDAQIFRTYSTMAELDTGAEKNKLRADWQAMQKERDKLVQDLPDFAKAYAASEGEPANVCLHIKGDPKVLGEEVPRGFLQVLGGQRVKADEGGSGRRQLAEWMTDPENPLTARVFVNRVWQHHFGHGLVRTPNDFGTRGAPPTHPQLLDWLTRRFIDSGWSIKSLHRVIMRSSAYQMAAVENADYARRDPDNHLLWSFNRRRLTAEELRDAMLAVSGELDRSPGAGHPFKPVWEWRYTQHDPFVDDFSTNKRSIYLLQPRIRQHPYLAVFDGADTNAATGLRQVSTTPQQSLFLMNSDFVHEQAARFAQRLAGETRSPGERIRRAFLMAFGRPADESEVAEGVEYIAQLEAPLEAAEVGGEERSHAAWASYTRVLLSSSEFMFVE